MNLFSSSKIWVLVKAVLDFLFFFALLSFLSSILSGKERKLLMCLVKLCAGRPLIWWLSTLSLIPGRCHWAQVTISQSEDMTVTRLTNKRPGLLRTHHYPGLVIVSCHIGQLLSSEVKQKLIKMPAQWLLWFPLISCELCCAVGWQVSKAGACLTVSSLVLWRLIELWLNLPTIINNQGGRSRNTGTHLTSHLTGCLAPFENS